MYYNTNSTTGTDLKAKWSRTEKQDEVVLALMAQAKDKTMTPRRVWWLYKHYVGPILLTSVRRSIDTLKKEGKVRETGDMLAHVCPTDNISTSERIIELV